MNSLILRTTGRWLLFILLVYSAYLLWRGHQMPGGGFVAGLMAAAAWALFAIAHGPATARIALRIDPRYLMAAGLGLSLLSCFSSALIPGGAPLQASWWHGWGLHLGTPMLFDFGVYFLVTGAALNIVLDMEEI